MTGVNHGGRTQRPTEPRARATAGTPESSRTTVRPEGGADLLNCEEPVKLGRSVCSGKAFIACVPEAGRGPCGWGLNTAPRG